MRDDAEAQQHVEAWRRAHAREGFWATYTYVEWWFDNHGDRDDYTVGVHAEIQMRAFERGALRALSPLAAYDAISSRFRGCLRDEAFRRWWIGRWRNATRAPDVIPDTI